MKTISYVFISGRKDKFYSGTVEAKEFYYGLTYFSDLGYKINIIEFDDDLTKPISFLRIFDKILNKLFSIPSYTHKLNSISNFKKLKDSDNIILVSESTGYSALFMLFFLRNKSSRVSLFVMGMYSKKIRFRIFRFIHNFFIRLLVLLIDDVFILGKGEYNKAIKFHKKSKKLYYFPFCIDIDFWKNTNNKNITANEEVLFVGNDGNRDFELLTKITRKLENLNFRLISENELVLKANFKNTKTHKGRWGSQEITDLQLKNYYLNSRFVILPLKNSTQPSGQSVSLQAMSLGVPVIISNTDGFWDRDVYEDNKSIIFVNSDSLDDWVKSISELYDNSEALKNISERSSEIVKKDFSLDNFNKMLSDILNI